MGAVGLPPSVRDRPEKLLSVLSSFGDEVRSWDSVLGCCLCYSRTRVMVFGVSRCMQLLCFVLIEMELRRLAREGLNSGYSNVVKIVRAAK